MSTLIGALFIVLGLSCIFKSDWWAQVDREAKAFGTQHRPDEIELSETRLAFYKPGGIAIIVFGLLIVFNVI